MIATTGNLHHFITNEKNEERFCTRLSFKSVARFLRFSKSAAEHQKMAESVEEFLTGDYHDAQRN